ncbi:MAG: DUF1266 domain-containing protein [Rikenellaceae bacterium]|nr:DUF1266 domain-containing protein [Rikenellaceae bacterium]
MRAGRRLQETFGSWDEFMRCYLLGYCFWSGEAPDDEQGEAATRRRIYEHYKHLRRNPWQTEWGTELKI